MQTPPAEVGPLRVKEQAAACAEVGVDDLTILDHPDGMLVYSLDLRRDIARRIREFRPDAVAVGSWDIEVGWGLNQADHRVAGLAALDAVRDADNTWVHPELAEREGLPKWHVDRLLVYGHKEPTHGVPLSHDDVAAAVASLSRHEAYFADLPDHPAPADFIPDMLARQGAPIGAAHDLLMRIFDL